MAKRQEGQGPRGSRPSIHSPCVADRHHGPGERIAEFNANDGTGRGGLLALRFVNGVLVLSLYRIDGAVTVDVDPARILQTASNVEAMRRAVAEYDADGAAPGCA